jgi:hypothetical protein
MAYEHNPGNGSLFKNKSAKTDKSPAYTGGGKIVIPPMPNGGEFIIDIAGWVKDGANGKYISLSLKEDKYSPQASEYVPGSDAQEMDDDLPF